LLTSQRFLAVTWRDVARTSHFPYLWLRDNCQCGECFHPITKARLLKITNLKLDSVPVNVQVSPNRNDVTVTWNDGHVSHLDSHWLWERRFDEDGQTTRKHYQNRRAKLWGPEMLDNIQYFDFEKALTDDGTLYSWLCAMEDYGFAMFRAIPGKTGQIQRMVDRISFLKTSHFGHTFQVVTSAKPSSLAYTTGDLPLHTDLFGRDPPGIQLLHYITQTPMAGGLSEWSDAFYSAQQLREQDPEAFRLLVQTPVDYIDVGDDAFGKYSNIAAQYTINLDHEGDLFQVLCANHNRDSHIRVPPEVVEKFLRALHKFYALLYQNSFTIKPQEGEVCCFYNNRVMHGRTSYEMTPGLERHLEGVYMEVDEITSRRRVLQDAMDRTEQ